MKSTAEYIENETEKSYTIRTDKMKNNETLVCRDDPDMRIYKDEKGAIFISKKSFRKCIFTKK